MRLQFICLYFERRITLKEIKKDNITYYFDSSIDPVAHVDLNEPFLIETVDCYGDALKSEKDLRSDFPDLIPNGATGPVFIKDIKKNDTLMIEILKIQIDKQGVMTTRPGGGLLGDLIEEHETWILPVYDNHILFEDKLKIPINKMIGVIGTAPEVGSIRTSVPGKHGGNLDTKEITEGSTLYLPAYHDGGLLSIGDLHAGMSDGEISGTGVEVSGKVILRVKKRNDIFLNYPVVETAQSTLIISSDDDINGALRDAAKTTIDLLMRKHKISFTEAYRLISIVGDVEISQLVNPKVTVRISVPKSILKI